MIDRQLSSGEFLPYKWKILNSGELLPYKWRILNSKGASAPLFFPYRKEIITKDRRCGWKNLNYTVFLIDI